MSRTIHAACPHDCPDACGVLITVDEVTGRATKIQGDPTHPVTRGFLCAKVTKYLDRVYSPDRLLYPMKRVQPKGPTHSGPAAFQRISWEEAFGLVVDKIRQVTHEFGPESVVPYSYGGTLGQLGNASMDHRFFHRLGASQLDRTICATAGGDALISVYGKKLGTEPEQFRHSRYIIAWGANVHGNNIHLWPFIEEAKHKGAKLVVIDPYRTRTAKLADWHIAINPGTDAALAMAMMRVILEEDLHDAEYVAQATQGFAQLRDRVMEAEYAPENVARITGISADEIRTLAREYATTPPAVIRVNYGVQRCSNGGTNMRAIAMLPCLIGAWKQAGGGLQLSTSGSFPINKDALHRFDLMEKSPLRRASRVINMSDIGRSLTSLTQSDTKNPPIKLVFVFNSNPVAVAPNHHLVAKGFSRPDLFTVVHEQFFTDTTDYADLVLPATTFFEHKDLQTSYGHYYVQMSEAAIAPLGESRSNMDVFRELALRMGFDQGPDGDPCFRQTDDEMIDQLLKSEHPWLHGITRERLEKEGHLRLNFSGNGDAGDAESKPFLPFADGRFFTASGKAELFNESLKAKGMDPVLRFVAPAESRHSAKAKKYPLEMLSRKADNHLNSTFCNLPTHQKLEEPHLLELSQSDAEARGIREGDAVRIFNDRGEIRLKARLNGAVRPGVVASKLDWARSSPDGVNVNVLTPDTLTDLGGGATFYSCLVEVEKA